MRKPRQMKAAESEADAKGRWKELRALQRKPTYAHPENAELDEDKALKKAQRWLGDRIRAVLHGQNLPK
jgi:hypothetical protein